jgi:phosphate/sulfate permease
MTSSLVFGTTGFLMAAYAVIANDSAQTLGTFISSNKESAWWKKWLVMSTILVATLTYAWLAGDVAHGRLNSIPLPETFHWYHTLAPLLLLMLTRFGIPVSTTILTLSVFSSKFVLQKILLKSAVGYGLAAVIAYCLWFLITKFLNEASEVPKSHEKGWRAAQWLATGFLWHQWLAHDIANVAVYLPRGTGLDTEMFVGFLILLVAGLARLFYTHGGKIQEIVQSKSGTAYVRSATIVDFVYALILLYFKQYNDIPMSTTWVFVGLLCGRELAIYRKFNKDKQLTEVFPMLAADFLKMSLGLALSIVLVFIVANI